MRITYVALVSAAVAFSHSPSKAATTNAFEAPSISCESLKSADLSSLPDAPSQITAANLIAPNAEAPRHCQISGYTAPQVGFDVRLPASSWNGKFLMVGCGGTCGSLATVGGACNEPLKRGYACIASDMGHKGLIGDGLWAYNNLQAEIDFAYRATHVATIAGKAIVQRYYSREAQKTYFIGCSAGGRQGLVAAQRFPWDFDGIVAGAPPISRVAQLANQSMALFVASRSSNGNSALPSSAIQLIHDAAVAECDLDDGVKDGIIGDPRACGFDPSRLTCTARQTDRCLTDLQADTAKNIYRGVRGLRSEMLSSGAAIGSELSWIPLIINRDGTAGTFASNLNTILRYLSFVPDPGPRFELSDFDFQRDYKRLAMMDALLGATNPDLRGFHSAGGKLILYSGWNDIGVLPGQVIDYYETVERTMGGRSKTQDFFRLFMLPGVNHCVGGPGADIIDYLAYLEAWVERSEPPDFLTSAHFEDPPGDCTECASSPQQASFTRPVFPYPSRAVYTGKGSPRSAENFRPTHP